MSYKYPKIPVGNNNRVKLNQVSNHLLLRIVRRNVDLRNLDFSKLALDGSCYHNPLPNMTKVMTLARQLLIKRRCI